MTMILPDATGRALGVPRLLLRTTPPGGWWERFLYRISHAQSAPDNCSSSGSGASPSPGTQVPRGITGGQNKTTRFIGSRLRWPFE